MRKMQVGSVRVEEWLAEKLPLRRLGPAAAVLLLHIIILFLFLRAGIISVPPGLTFHELPITIWLSPPKKPPPRAPEKPQPVPAPVPTPTPIERTLHDITVPPPSALPQSSYDGMRALGRYMKNCSNGEYEYLSNNEWHLCLGGPRQAPMALGLGQEAPSIWQQQRDAARKPGAPFESPCPQGSLNANTGVPPCHNFTGSLFGVSKPPAQ